MGRPRKEQNQETQEGQSTAAYIGDKDVVSCFGIEFERGAHVEVRGAALEKLRNNTCFEVKDA